ncbi:3-dehydroquinate synthase [soil metagenome]
MVRFLIGDSSEVLVGRGLPEPLLGASDRRSLVAILCQPGAGAVAAEVAARVDVDTFLIELPPGEEAKDLRSLERVYTALADRGLAREDTVITVGGGAATDAGGFVAATWLRGVEAVYVPTTVLGAVDASIGGKTAVNVAGKNLVGVFRHPSRVVVDLDVLDGLPPVLRRHGAAEAVKAGFLAAPDIVAAYMEAGLDAPLERVVTPAIAVKTRIVDADFTDQGQRTFLNLGHTVGHAVEYASGMPHGEAVAIGLVAAAAVSERKLGFGGAEEVRTVLDRLDLPSSAPGVDRDRVIELLWLDKKRDRRGIRMVLLAAIGNPQLHHVDASDIDHALAAIGI